MITVGQTPEGHVIITMDVPDRIAIRNLALAYAIPFDVMLVGCINKGIDVIGKQVQHSKEHNKHEDGYNGTD
ncbi:hypothetical protein LCGC14_1047270 [marine sediment metagenome]|uniref:Uncharacterized protein n=1 Tax=marine sediment metagenome TaxID=412755 RepID=A0A0F9Q844_9ZZZZ